MRKCVNDLFVEGTCNVLGVNVCVVFECYGVVALLCRSFVCWIVYCVPVSASISSVIPWFFDVFPPDICLVCVYEGGDLFV